MTKSELSKALHTIDIPVNEGLTSDENLNKYPRIVYWPYMIEDVLASEEIYENRVTYQISFYSKTNSMDSKLMELKNILNEKGLHPDIYIEFVKKDKVWHCYFSLEVLE